MAKPMQLPDRTRRRDYRSSRERLLRTARELMAERGPAAVTVSEVAHRAALNRTTAYQHFRTRDELVAAVFADLANDVARMLVAPMPIGADVAQVSLGSKASGGHWGAAEAVLAIRPLATSSQGVRRSMGSRGGGRTGR